MKCPADKSCSYPARSDRPKLNSGEHICSGIGRGGARRLHGLAVFPRSNWQRPVRIIGSTNSPERWRNRPRRVARSCAILWPVWVRFSRGQRSLARWFCHWVSASVARYDWLKKGRWPRQGSVRAKRPDRVKRAPLRFVAPIFSSRHSYSVATLELYVANNCLADVGCYGTSLAS